ncbi:hypothetical protein NBRC116594_13470 [Shimia sp. NS0008-38b]
MYEIVLYDGHSTLSTAFEFEEGKSFARRWHPGRNAHFEAKVRVAFVLASEGQSRGNLPHTSWEVWAEKANEKRQHYYDGSASPLERAYISACGA